MVWTRSSTDTGAPSAARRSIEAGQPVLGQPEDVGVVRGEGQHDQDDGDQDAPERRQARDHGGVTARPSFPSSQVGDEGRERGRDDRPDDDCGRISRQIGRDCNEHSDQAGSRHETPADRS